ncbi:MAG: hypothetical protein WCH34_10265 [Bacteroidota bacterium]
MSKELQISGLIVLKLDRNGNVLEIAEAAMEQNASSVPALSGISHDDAEMHVLGTELRTVNTKYQSNPPTATRGDVEVAVNNVVDAYDDNAGDIQKIARQQAKLAGDVNVGINIVTKAGYKLKSPKGAMFNGFDVQPDGEGAVKIKTKAVAPRAIYIRQFGKASGKNVEPIKANLEELLISTENDIRVDELESGSWYAFREATVLPISRKAKSGTPTTNVGKNATLSLATKAHRRTYHGGGVSNYKFGGWIWVLVP